jgi:hypothetical protein
MTDQPPTCEHCGASVLVSLTAPARMEITDEMVEAGARVHAPFAFLTYHAGGFVSPPIHREEACEEARLILTAALGAKP